MYKVKKKHTALVIVLVCLLFGSLLSLTLLFSIITKYSVTQFEHIIPLSQPSEQSDNNFVTSQYNRSKNIVSQNITASNTSSSSKKANPSFRVYDSTGVWTTQTELEIFSLSYDNEKGEVTVIGDSGNTDKLIAPGTSNEYSFTLENTGNVTLGYSMTMNADVTGTQYLLPVKVSIHDYKNNYLVGSSGSKDDINKINSVNENALLSAGRYAVYTIEWEWPFEQGIDDYDTMLGNLAVNDDIVLRILINITASYSDNMISDEITDNSSSSIGGSSNNSNNSDNYGLTEQPQNNFGETIKNAVKTSDRHNSNYVAIVFLVSFALIVCMILLSKKIYCSGEKNE